VNLRRAAAWLALALMVAALPAPAVVLPKFGAAKSGAAAPEGSPPPHGATGTAGRGGRVPHPELLRAAVEADAETLHGRTPEETQAAVREQAAQAQPWMAAPHMRVRLTGDPVVDAVLLKSLNAELATAMDPDRVRAGSLADDALADDTLAGLLPRRPGEAQRRLWKFLRGYPPQLDLYHLTQALRPLQGDTLLVMGHVDATDGALVFKAGNGRPLRLPLALFEQAARDAGVQLLTVGCRSARYTSAGFVDDLNGLDAARAMARALHARPATLFDLFSALSGPQMVMQFNAETFSTTHAVELTAGPEGAALSTLRWNGPTARAAAQAASAVSAPPAPPAPFSGWWSNPALPWLGGAVVASLLAGTAVSRGQTERGGSLARRVSLDVLGHLLLLPLVLTVLAESVAGASGAWWAWVGGPALVLVAVLCVVITRSDPEVRDERGLWLLGAVRAVIVALPLLALAPLHAGWQVWPAPVMQALLALYGLGRPLPGPWPMIGGAFLLAWLGGMALAGVESVGRLRAERRGRAGRGALWFAQLAADGVTGAPASAAVSARLAFERRCGTPVEWQVRWDQVKTLTDGHAPDPWAGLPQRHWRVVAVPLLPPQQPQGVESQTAFGLLRVGSPFVHPLPPLLLQRWREQALRAADLPVLLAQVEPRLIWADFLPPGQLPRLRGVLIFGTLISASFAGTGLAFDEGERRFMQGLAAVLAALFVALPAVLLLRQRWHERWLLRVGVAATPAQAQQPPTAAAG